MNQEVQFMPAVYRLSRSAPAGETGIAVARLGTSDGFQSYLDRLMKMIPAEVIGLYLVGGGIIPAGQAIALIIWTVVCLIAVVVVRIYGTYDPTKQHPLDWPHIVISSVAFLIWIYTIGGPFAAYGLTIPWVGSLLVLVWTFFTPIFYYGAD
jgi:hypothetical protein